MTDRELPKSLDGLSRDQLLEWKAIVENECGSIRAQISEAKGRFAASGERADQDWYNRATVALRIRGAQAQRIARQLGKLREATKAANIRKSMGIIHDDHQKFLHAFFQAAKRLLSEEEYRRVTDQALLWKMTNSPESTDCDWCKEGK